MAIVTHFNPTTEQVLQQYIYNIWKFVLQHVYKLKANRDLIFPTQFEFENPNNTYFYGNYFYIIQIFKALKTFESGVVDSSQVFALLWKWVMHVMNIKIGKEQILDLFMRLHKKLIVPLYEETTN